jgi:hypothetical protein
VKMINPVAASLCEARRWMCLENARHASHRDPATVGRARRDYEHEDEHEHE